jgi:hypothetical protein
MICEGVHHISRSKLPGFPSFSLRRLSYAHLAPDSLDGALSALAGKPTSVQEGLHDTQQLRQSHDSTDVVTLKVGK